MPASPQAPPPRQPFQPSPTPSPASHQETLWWTLVGAGAQALEAAAPSPGPQAAGSPGPKPCNLKSHKFYLRSLASVVIVLTLNPTQTAAAPSLLDTACALTFLLQLPHLHAALRLRRSGLWPTPSPSSFQTFQNDKKMLANGCLGKPLWWPGPHAPAGPGP